MFLKKKDFFINVGIRLWDVIVRWEKYGDFIVNWTNLKMSAWSILRFRDVIEKTTFLWMLLQFPLFKTMWGFVVFYGNVQLPPVTS